MSSAFYPPPHSPSREFLLGRENYERWRTMPYDQTRMGLQRMQRLLEELGSPEERQPVIHVAGTKGKGSTAAMVAAALTAAGYRTGLFTSPHLERIEERIQTGNGDITHFPERPEGCLAKMSDVPVSLRCIEAEEFDSLLEQVRPAVERMDAESVGNALRGVPGELDTNSGTPQRAFPTTTFFEIITAMAFLHFAQQKVDAAVMEVGLGGRLDATNVCRPVVSVITSISFDHMQQLGNTLAAIAGEKAGIIKPGVPVVSGVIEPEPRDVIRQVCRERGAPLIERGVAFDFTYEPPRHLERAAASGILEYRRVGQDRVAGAGPPTQDTPVLMGLRSLEASLSHTTSYSLSLPGRHQAANAATALAAIDVLHVKGWNIPDAAVASALGGITWPARVEVVARRPAVVLDAAHNVASVEALLLTLRESFSTGWRHRRHLIFGTTQDKDVRGMLASLLKKGVRTLFQAKPSLLFFDDVYFTRYRGSTRAVPPEELQRIAEELTGQRWPIFDDSAAAWSAVGRAAGPDDMICITGSFFLAAEMREQVTHFDDTKPSS
jgi:dihydrofolate synthase/folylpolyglutamate synthase